MVTNLSKGDIIQVGESVTLTLLDVQGDLIRFGVESSEPSDPDLSVLIEGLKGGALNWWELN